MKGINDNVWYDNAVIKPPESDYDEKRYTRLAVDSKDRDYSVHPLPSTYSIPLQDDIEDIVTAELVSYHISFTGYMINSYHNTFTFTISPSSTVYTVTLDDGDYTATALASEIQTKMNAAIGSSVFSVTYNSKIGKLLFTHSSANFTLSFVSDNAKSLCRLMGFVPTRSSTSAAQTLLAPCKVNLDYFKYVVMYIDQFTSNKGSNSTTNNSFAVLYETTTNKCNDDCKIIKKFTPPLARLQRLNISFYDRDGNPYDFNGVDHSFEILFTSYKQKRKYNSMSFGR